MDPQWRSEPLPTVAQSGDFSFRTRPVSPWQGDEPAAWEEPPPCQPGSLEMKRRAHIKMWIEGQLEGLLPTSHPESPLLSTTPARYGCKTLVAIAEQLSLSVFGQCEEARIASLTTTYPPETFSQSDGPMLVAEADPSYRLDTTGPVPRIIPGPAAQAVADLEDDSGEEEFLEQAPITQWEEAEVASLTTTFHSETSSQEVTALLPIINTHIIS
ncbi:uncharacterized protein LOC111192916 [Astyanax mexicanus]|uniref:uncharacterized protein LOC111192916 n=1 Tax=Astyanax mexicanus TaxID=7994 RepID=UPI0020CB09BE|nr:uncharacterized protein LOC111192916 [Astyanax mexicanus]